MENFIFTKLKSGAIWIGIAQVVGQFIRLGSNLILAWLLTPDAFGLAALAMTLFTGLVLMSDLGTGASLIRSKHADSPPFYNTVFTIQFGQGALLFLVCLLLASPMAGFYDEPALQDMIMFGGFGLFLQGSRSTSWPLLQRDMRIKRLTVYGMITQLTGVSATIAYAFFYPEPLALIIGFVVSAFVATLISHLLHRHEIRNRLSWDASSFHEIFHFGKWIFISSILNFLSQRSDRFILGKLSSVETLGVYHVAMMLADLPRFAVHLISERLLYPTFAHYAKEDVVLLNKKILQIRSVLLPAMWVSSLIVIVLADPFFFYLYKDSYHDAMWIAPCLVLMLWYSILINAMDRIPVALGDSKLLAKMWTLILPVKVVCAYAGYLYFGLAGFIAGLTLGSFAGYLRLTLAARKIGLNFLKQDCKYTITLLLVTALYFYLKVWMRIPLGEINIWLSTMAFLVISLCGGGIVVFRIKKLIGQVDMGKNDLIL